MSSMRSCLIVPMASISDTMFASAAGMLLFDFTNVDAMERHVSPFRLARAVNCPSRILVRLPHLDDPFFGSALEALRAAPPDGVVLQATEGAPSVQQLGSRLAVFEAEAAAVDGATHIVAEISTPRGVLSAATLAGASKRLQALLFGRAALASALRTDEASVPVESARGLVVLAAVAAGAQAIDGPSREPARLEEECLAARRDGFFGKCAAREEDIGVIERLLGAPDVEKSPHSAR